MFMQISQMPRKFYPFNLQFINHDASSYLDTLVSDKFIVFSIRWFA